MRWALIGVLLVGGLGCSYRPQGRSPDFSTLSYPLGMAVSPDQRHLFVVNTNFDLDYSRGWVGVVDLESKRLLSNSGIEVPSYGGLPVWGPDQAHLYIPIREDSSIIVADVKDGGITCSSEGKKTCSSDHVLYDSTVVDPQTKEEERILGTDAFSACVMKDTPWGPLLFVASISDSFLAVYSIKKVMPTFLAHIKLDPGVVSLVCDEENLRVFAAHRSQNLIDVIEVKKERGGYQLEVTSSFAAPMSGHSLDYFRDMILEHGKVLYALYRNVNALIVIDVSDKLPKYVTSTNLPQGVASMRLLEDPQWGRYMFVTCTEDSSIVVLDMEILTPVKRLVLGRSPYGIVLLPSKKEAVVSCFQDHALALLKWEDDPARSLKIEGWIR